MISFVITFFTSFLMLLFFIIDIVLGKQSIFDFPKLFKKIYLMFYLAFVVFIVSFIVKLAKLYLFYKGIHFSFCPPFIILLTSYIVTLIALFIIFVQSKIPIIREMSFLAFTKDVLPSFIKNTLVRKSLIVVILMVLSIVFCFIVQNFLPFSL
ncbi:NEQ296 [Nanoarchaeum equitans Kin4-M]|uniref:NEQ296 n=1 Tax=Nanoarchaeum equitans (strain Kin4-M) TaxID=228908 RepID=Q74NG9_NANEQ|nr:NEQ296 [Nanoarchaeum equitans Kin4-M]